MHEAPHHAAVLQNIQACDASRLRRLESSRVALLLWGLGLRRRPPALGLVNAQRYETHDARWYAHPHFKVGALPPKSPLCRGPCRRCGPLALGQAQRALAYSREIWNSINTYFSNFLSPHSRSKARSERALGSSCRMRFQSHYGFKR
jgi:hypothetical protein